MSDVVSMRQLRQLYSLYLVESADGRHEDDSGSMTPCQSQLSIRGSHLRIVEVGDPRMPLTTGTAYVEQVPSHSTTVKRDIEDVFRDSHCLYACM